MDRIHALVLALLIAAVALFGLSYVVDGPPGSTASSDALTRGFGSDGQGPRRVSMWSSERETRRAGKAPGQSDDESGERRRRWRFDTEAIQASDLISGGLRELRPARRQRGSTGTGDLIAGIPGGLTSRLGAMPRGGGASSGGGGDGPGRHVFEFVDEPRDDGGGDVLLSIPFKGGIDAETGGDPIQVDGLIVKGNSVEFTEDAQLIVPAGGHVNGEAGSIAFEIQPNWSGADETNNSMVLIHTEHQWENNLSIVKNYNSLRFIIIDETGFESNVNVYIDDWVANEPRRVTATWGESSMSLYVDGQLVGQSPLPNRLAFNDSTPIHIGSDFPGSQYRGAQGKISDLKLYGRALGPQEIR
ncbi:MAG: LamG domain-containing protein [Candidatus Binatia bacterium]